MEHARSLGSVKTSGPIRLTFNLARFGAVRVFSIERFFFCARQRLIDMPFGRVGFPFVARDRNAGGKRDEAGL